MCGIAGLFSYDAATPHPSRLDLCMARMAPRGPDGEGRWQSTDGSLHLGHRRLSIIDLDERANQPMVDEIGRYVIVFNGEIYNYMALRDELQSRGVNFQTMSDTEVVLRLYIENGPEFIGKLRGMFALAIWDNRERSLFLARDLYGIKPLYYSQSGGEFMFASQVKALKTMGVSTEVDPAGVVGFYLFGSVPEPYTYLRHVSALPAGTSLEIDARGNTTQRRFGELRDAFAKSEMKLIQYSNEATRTEQREALLSAIRSHLVADVPVGLFLSAGIDSGALLALMSEVRGNPITTFTLAFKEFLGTQHDESVLATEMASKYGAEHITHIVSEHEFSNDIMHVLDSMDQPSVDGINTFFVSKAASEHGLKVALSGAGGDELFGGYPTFSTIARDLSILSPLNRMGLRRTPRRPYEMLRPHPKYLAGHLDPKIWEILRYGGEMAGAYLIRRCVLTPSELTDVIDYDFAVAGMERLDPIGLLQQQLPDQNPSNFACVATLESSMFLRNQLLRDADWAGMANSLEIRVPLVDSVLLKLLAPGLDQRRRINKMPLANSLSSPLPGSIINRPKTGFSTPISKWLQSDDRLHSWASVPALSHPKTKWAKRWANVVANEFKLH